MELCPGTFLTVIKYGKAKSTHQKNLGAAIFNALQPGFISEDDDSGISAVFRGNRNIGSFIQLNYEEMKPSEIVVRVRDEVLPLLDRNKWNDIVCAIKLLVKQSGIDKETEIELINQQKCQEVLDRQEIVFSDFLAGILMYVVRYTDNLHKESCVKEITEEYIQNAVKNYSNIHFIDSYSLGCLDSIGTVISDVKTVNMIVQVGGNCIVCGKPLISNDFVCVVARDGTEFPVCIGCSGSIKNASESQLNEYKQIKNQLEMNLTGRRQMSSNHLGEDVKTIIRIIGSFDFSTVTPVRMDPRTVRNKVSDVQLRREILNDVYDCYHDVNEIIEEKAASGELNVRSLEKVVKRMYEDREESVSESDVYNTLVNIIHEQTGRINRGACHIIVSYFVQRCEVFG